MDISIEKALQKSKFRSSFKLTPKDLLYIDRIGLDKLKSHVQDFILRKISPANPKNDGKQTPLKGHPVFIAQHATATCCRGCIYKWHKIPKKRNLSEAEISFIESLIIRWINRELKNNTV
ncbi:MAG: DUF4186 domain-containing protein [Candidatus Omnitrophica bacterium]|nr:DUF4186 domain-containing protein [Candidatus Omnitrophota bacterium]